MSWNPNNAARQFQQQAQQQAQHFHRHNQQIAAKQMDALIAQGHARHYQQQPKHVPQQQDHLSVQPDGVLAQPERQAPKLRGRSNAALVLDVAIVAMVLVIIAVASVSGYRALSKGGLLPAGGGGGGAVAGSVVSVTGSVRVGSNVRQGPGTSFPVVTVLPPGADVKVSCVDAGWARLASPYAGRYIARSLLALTEDPKPC